MLNCKLFLLLVKNFRIKRKKPAGWLSKILNEILSNGR